MVTVNRDITEADAMPAMVNRLTEAGTLRQPPPLMLINGGCCPKMPSVIVLTEAVAIMRPPQIQV